MDQHLANEITLKVISDVSFWTAVIGFVGVIVGALTTTLGNYLMYKVQGRQQKTIDGARKNMLHQMLSNTEFEEGRSLETLAKVTGASPEDCRRLLIEIGARGFTLKGNREGWTYIKNRPLSEQ